MVRYTECWARDGIQAEAFVATERKIEVIDAASRAGLDRVEVASLSRASTWPQSADSEAVIAGFTPRQGTSYSAYVPNNKGLERLLNILGDDRRIDTVLVAIAASDSYNVKNVGRPTSESMREILAIIKGSVDAGFRIVATVGTAWACPIEGAIPAGHVRRLAKSMVDAGANELVLGDTTGEANIATVAALVSSIKSEFDVPISGHFHDARGTAMANALAAVSAGIDRVEGALGGVGGHPPDEDQLAPSPNLCTEDFLVAALSSGIQLDVDIDLVLEAGKRAEVALGRRLASRVQQNGLPASLDRGGS